MTNWPMKGWEDWKLLAIVPLTAGVLAVITFAFMADADHSVQFFGAFTAAMVAAITVILSTYLQADLRRKQDAEARRVDILADAVELYSWLDVLAIRLDFISTILSGQAKIKNQLTVAQCRSNVPPDLQTQLRARLKIASRIPQPMGHSIVDLLHASDTTLDFTAYLPTLSDTTTMPLPQLERRAEAAERRAKQINYRRAMLGQFLLQEGFLGSLDARDRQALLDGFPDDP